MDKMEIKIEKDVLDKTTKCNCDFSCLSGDNTCRCEVIEMTGISSIKVNPNPNLPCSYHLPFHKSHFCVCPTRRELYKQYKI